MSNSFTILISLLYETLLCVQIDRPLTFLSPAAPLVYKPTWCDQIVEAKLSYRPLSEERALADDPKTLRAVEGCRKSTNCHVASCSPAEEEETHSHDDAK